MAAGAFPRLRAPTTRSWPPTASTARRWPGASPMDRVMAEMFGRVDGVSRGRGGSMHLFDAATRFYGGNAIVAGGLPIAVGLALADRMQGRDRVTACFFGEGAVDEGEFHESLNLAALWDLPVLFACENNRYSMGMAVERAESQTDLALKAAAYGMPAWSVDGMDVEAVAARDPAGGRRRPRRRRARTSSSTAPTASVPTRCTTPTCTGPRTRSRPGSSATRSPPTSTCCVSAGVARRRRARGARGRDRGRDRRRRRLRRGRRRWSPSRTCRRDVHQRGAEHERRRSPSGRPCKAGLREALTPRRARVPHGRGRRRLRRLLRGHPGPARRVRSGARPRHPVVGVGLRRARASARRSGGMRPIVEIMTCNFSLLALDQIVNNAATLLHMSGGQFNVPLVIRTTAGAGRQLAAQHSHSFEPLLRPRPGPAGASTPATHRGRPRHAADRAGGPRPRGDLRVPDRIIQHGGRAGRRRRAGATSTAPRSAVPGTDVTLVTYGATLHTALAAADDLAGDGASRPR